MKRRTQWIKRTLHLFKGTTEANFNKGKANGSQDQLQEDVGTLKAKLIEKFDQAAEWINPPGDDQGCKISSDEFLLGQQADLLAERVVILKDLPPNVPKRLKDKLDKVQKRLRELLQAIAATRPKLGADTTGHENATVPHHGKLQEAPQGMLASLDDILDGALALELGYTGIEEDAEVGHFLAALASMAFTIHF